MRRTSALAALIALLALAACAPAPRAGWSPPPWPDSEVGLVAAPSAIDLAGDPQLAGSLLPMRIRDDATGIQARAAFLPGTAAASGFNAAVEGWVRSAIDARTAASGVAYTPSVHPRGTGLADRDCVAGSTTLTPGELLADPAAGPAGASGTAVVCDIVVASGPILAQRLRVVTGTPDAVTGDAVTILYADIATGEVVTADALWSEAAASALTADIVELLRREAGSLSLAPASASVDDALVAAVHEALATTVLAKDALVVTIAPGFTSPALAALGVAATTDPLTVSIPSDVAAPLVTPFGAHVLEASGQPFSGLSAPRDHGVWLDCALVPCVAVTYDDGPSDLTPGILDELAARHAAATFFPMGKNAAAYRDTLARMTAEGHEVANHTWNHPHLRTLTPAQVTAQIVDATQAISSASGQPVTAFRPPYGEFNPTVLAAAGLPAILWDVDTLDWQGPSDDVLISRAVDEPRPGSIVLMHDVHAVTARTAGAIYDGLLDRGFALVTVEQLFGGALPSSGAWGRAP